MTARRTAILVVTVASLVLASLGSPLVGPVAAAQDEAAVYDAPGGAQISTATDGETVYINATAGTLNGTEEQVTVTNGTASITITMYDTGAGSDPTGSDGEYWGSFNLSATTTDDASDTLLVQKGSSASATVDLDGDGNSAPVSVTADYGPVPTGATTYDNTTDGTVDNVTVTFDEAVKTSSAYATDNFTVGGATVSGIADNDGDDTLRLELSSATANETGLTPDVTVSQNAVQDTNGNAGPAGSSVTVTASDGAAPIALNASYRDTNADGTVDRVDVRYSEDVSASSYVDGDWSIPVDGTISLTKDSSGTVSNREVRIDVTGTANNTGGSIAPTVDYAGTNITDGQNAAPAQTLTVRDRAAPTFVHVETANHVRDGLVDNLTVTFTEEVASGSVEAADFSIGTANNLSGTVSDVSSDGGGYTVDVVLSHPSGGQADTGATPTLAYASGSEAAIQDAAGNRMLDTTSAPAIDKASPYAIEISMLDGPTADGQVDRIEVLHSEDVSDSSPTTGAYSLNGSDADAVTIDQASVNGSSVILNVTAPANDTGLNLTLTYHALGGSITDGSNPAIYVQNRSVKDAAAPLMQSVTTLSFGGGTVDWLEVVFTESIDDGTVDAHDSLEADDFSLSSGVVDGFQSSIEDDNQIRISVSGSPPYDTSFTPDVTLKGDSIQDLATTPNSNPKQTLTASDGAPPDIIAASTADADGDGAVDRIDVAVSEPIDDGASTLDASAFSLSAGSVDGVDTGTADDAILQLSVSGLSGSDATPNVTAAAGTLVDPLGNTIPESTTFTGTTSGAAPAVERATTLDRDGDGNVDAATLTFTGAIDDSTVTPGDWTLGGAAVEAVNTLSAADDDTIQLRITTGVSGTGPAAVTYTPGSTTGLDGSSIAAITDSDVDETDGATPVIGDVSASTDDATPSRVEITVVASEPLDAVTVDLSGPDSQTVSSFTTLGSGPYTHTLTTTVDTSGTYTVSLQRAADAAGNDGAAGQQATVAVSVPSSGGGGAPSAPGSPSTHRSSATVSVFSNIDAATFDLSDGPVSRIEVRSQGSATGFARATSLSSLPSGTPSPDGQTVSAVSLQMPGEWRTSDATVRMTLDAAAVDVDPGRLRVARYDGSSWSTLETSVERGAGRTLVVTAQTPGFSVFAVTAVEESSDATTTPAQTDEVTVSVSTATSTADGTTPGTATATDTATSTTGDGAGFGALVAVLGLLGLVALRRRP
ncbi:hypothetical protein [Haloplanus halobius]|uniref:hypothetical protein n=1 Tax=Haloplanus halobius TaxID=2934938 RepID=UPI00200D085A|nr:hypothetical protein [Haloplanus sp. XH21]